MKQEVCSLQLVGNLLEQRYTLGTEANAKELGGVIILVMHLKFLGL